MKSSNGKTKTFPQLTKSWKQGSNALGANPNRRGPGTGNPADYTAARGKFKKGGK